VGIKYLAGIKGDQPKNGIVDCYLGGFFGRKHDRMKVFIPICSTFVDQLYKQMANDFVDLCLPISMIIIRTKCLVLHQKLSDQMLYSFKRP
jgi:hypothetical protein